MTAIRRSGEREFYATGVDTVAGFRAFFAHLVERSPFLTPGDIPHTVLQIQRRPLDYWATSPVLAEACVDVLAQRDPPRISRISLTGSRVSSEALARITSTFRSEVIIAYGSTEGGLLAQDVGRHDDPTYVGVIEAHLDLQVVDEHDHEVPVGTIGIIRYRHDAMPTSYLNDTDASVRAFRNGWFYPGDLGVVDDERRLRITGRLDELVNVGGTKVDPGTLDDVRLHVVGIEDAAGCGIRHDDGTVVLALAIVTNKTFVMGDLQTYLTREFGIAKPQIIATVPSIPRNAMGKVARADLALQLKDIVARD
jgi:acyl-coenzyme A synthetase/AMP-(fatty) acid ligase